MTRQNEEKEKVKARTGICYMDNQKESSGKNSLLQVGLKAPILERHIRLAKVGVLQRIPLGLGHRIPVRHGQHGAHGVRELQLVVGREAVKVLDLRRVPAGQRAGPLLVRAVARGGAAGNGRVGRVEPNDDVLPVVAVGARRDAVGGLVLGPVPRVHDGRLAVVVGDAGVGLALGLVAAGAAGVATGFEATAVGKSFALVSHLLFSFLMCKKGGSEANCAK